MKRRIYYRVWMAAQPKRFIVCPFTENVNWLSTSAHFELANFLWWEDRSVPRRMFSSVPNCCSLDANRALLRHCDSQKCLQTLSGVPWRTESLSAESHGEKEALRFLEVLSPGCREMSNKGCAFSPLSLPRGWWTFAKDARGERLQRRPVSGTALRRLPLGSFHDPLGVLVHRQWVSTQFALSSCPCLSFQSLFWKSHNILKCSFTFPFEL